MKRFALLISFSILSFLQVVPAETSCYALIPPTNFLTKICGPLPFTRPWAAMVSADTTCRNDRTVLLEKDFQNKEIEEAPPEGANGAEKALYKVYQQLMGRDYYRPANYMFFRQAVKEIGFFPAVFATFDRVLRDSKLGSADIRIDAEHPYVEEGPEASAPGRAGKK